MGAVAARLWERGTPRLRPEFGILQSWSREQLKKTVAGFREQKNMAVEFEDFSRLIQFPNSKEAELAFKLLANKKGRADFLSVIGSMVIMSDQQYISRVSFLFSVFDFDGSGEVNRAEFWIAMRTLFMGLAKLFENATVPGPSDVEKLTQEVFDRVDFDGSGCLMLGEALAFAYRSKGLKQIMEPFPAKDERIFEERVIFALSSAPSPPSDVSAAPKELALAPNKAKATTRQRLKTSPDPTEDVDTSSAPGMLRTASTPASPKAKVTNKAARKLTRRNKTSAMTVTKEHAWLLWKFLAHCSGDTSPTKIAYDVLQPFLYSKGKVQQALDEGCKRTEKGQMDRPKEDDIMRIKSYLVCHLASLELQKAFKEAEGQPISLRAFFCLVWSTFPESDIENCVKWCGLFTAKLVLEEILDEDGDGKVEDVDPEDVEAIFFAIDMNGDGRVTVEELVSNGGFSEAQAHKLMSLDRDRKGSLDMRDVKAAASRNHAQVSESFRGLFAHSAAAPAGACSGFWQGV